jgi:hypothetical protein
MEETILQLPLQAVAPPGYSESVSIIYQQQTQLLPHLTQDIQFTQDAGKTTQETKLTMSEEINTSRLAILKTLAIFHRLTAEQLTRLLYKPGSLTFVQSHVKYLVDEGFVGGLIPPKQIRYGTTQYVYGRTYAVE